MIYLFGTEDQVSVIMNERFLTEEQRAKATLVLETLPEPEERDGYYAVKYIDKDTKEFSYIYREIVEENEIKSWLSVGGNGCKLISSRNRLDEINLQLAWNRVGWTRRNMIFITWLTFKLLKVSDEKENEGD